MVVVVALSAWEAVVSGVVGLVAGVLVGAIGVGGVVIVPALIQLPALDVHIVVVAAMACYIVAGATGAWLYKRQGSVAVVPTSFVSAGAVPGAFGGSALLRVLDATVIKVVLLVLVLVSTLFSLRPQQQGGSVFSWCRCWCCARDGKKEGLGTPPPTTATAAAADAQADHIELAAAVAVGPQAPQHSPPAPQPAEPVPPAAAEDEWGRDAGSWQRIEWLLIGLIGGVGSALTGTSGPVIALPLLLLRRWPVRCALGCAQVMQVPIALAATLGNALFSTALFQWGLVALLACTLPLGVVAGAAIAHRTSLVWLKRAVQGALLIAGTVLLVRLILDKV